MTLIITIFSFISSSLLLPIIIFYLALLFSFIYYHFFDLRSFIYLYLIRSLLARVIVFSQSLLPRLWNALLSDTSTALMSLHLYAPRELRPIAFSPQNLSYPPCHVVNERSKKVSGLKMS